MNMTEGYCFKCKKRREMKNEVRRITKANTGMIQGKCVVCGTTVSKICSKKDVK